MSDSLKIYADLISEPSRTVLGFCRLSGVAYEFVPVDLVKGEYLSEEYAAINPYQAVPAIAHGSYKLNESGAIISYIADAFNVDNHWYPKDIKIRGRIQAFIHWHHQALRERKDEYLVPKVVMPLIAGAAPPSAEDEVKMAKSVDDAMKDFDLLLADTGYAARTAGPTVADIFAYNEVAMLQLLKIDVAQYPRVKTWYDEIGSNEVIQELCQPLVGFAATL